MGHSTCYIWYPTAADVPSEDNLLSGCPSPASTSGFFSFFFPFSIPFGRDEQVWGISLLLGMLFFRLYLIFLSITTYIWSSLEIHTIPCIFGYFFHGNTTYTWSICVPTYYIWFLTAAGIPDYITFYTAALSCFRGWIYPCCYQLLHLTSVSLDALISCFLGRVYLQSDELINSTFTPKDDHDSSKAARFLPLLPYITKTNYPFPHTHHDIPYLFSIIWILF